jgi:anti-sigma factor (TIGR02949 family)
MNCAAVGSWIDALLDGELDSKNAAEIEAHLAGCPACKRLYEVKQSLSSNMRRLDLGYAAPESLRLRISDALFASVGEGTLTEAAAVGPASGQTPVPGPRVAPAAAAATTAASASAPASAQPTSTRVTRGPARWFVLAGWPVALAASALLASVLLQQRSQDANEVVAAHVRSLLADHLNDVVSSSHHTVKPWFAGKIDFSPPVPDLSSLGFELVGGRLDYLESQPVAAVVYRKHGHIINVLASRPGRDTAGLPHTAKVQGYSLRSWQQSGLNFVAVSDIDPLELANLERAYETPAPAAAEPAENH